MNARLGMIIRGAGPDRVALHDVWHDVWFDQLADFSDECREQARRGVVVDVAGMAPWDAACAVDLVRRGVLADSDWHVSADPACVEVHARG